MYTTGCAHLTNYTAPPYSRLYEEKMHKNITFNFTDLWVCQWYVLQEGHEFSEYIKT